MSPLMHGNVKVKCIAGGIGDGSIQIWSIKPGWGSRPNVHIDKRHSDNITCLQFSTNGRTLLSRSFDGSLKVWDLRKMKEPLKVFEDLLSHYGQTNIAFSPDEQLFFAGTSIKRESSNRGCLCFYDHVNLELVSRVGISPTCSVVQCFWHPRLNQIFATVGDKSQRGAHILYNPTLNERGALVCVARAPRKKSIDDFEAKPIVHNPQPLVPLIMLLLPVLLTLLSFSLVLGNVQRAHEGPHAASSHVLFALQLTSHVTLLFTLLLRILNATYCSSPL